MTRCIESIESAFGNGKSLKYLMTNRNWLSLVDVYVTHTSVDIQITFSKLTFM